MAGPARPTSTAELQDGVARLLRRLSRGLDAIDDGDLSGVDDVGGILRTLIADAAGNNALKRLASATGTSLGQVRTTGRPVVEPHCIFAVGLLPTTRPATPPNRDHVHTLDFESWTRATSLELPRARRRQYSWSRFANEIGNTFGNHLSTTVPDLLDESQMFELSGFTLHHALLRQVGWQVERTAGDLLRTLGEAVAPSRRAIELFNVQIGGGHAELHNGQIQWGMWVSMSAFPAEIMSFEWGGTHSLRADERGRPVLETPFEHGPLSAPSVS